MPFFQYKAVTARGRGPGGRARGLEHPGRGRAPAGRWASSRSAREEAGVARTAAAAGAGVARRSSRRTRITQDDIGVVTRELATLLKAGLPLDRSFEILINLAAEPARGGAAGPRAQRRARRRVAFQGARRAARHLHALLREHDPRGRGGRQPAHRAAAPRRVHGARQGAARQRHGLAHLPGVPRGGLGDRGGGAAGRRGAALQADLRRHGQGDPVHDAGGALRRRRDAQLRLAHADRGGRGRLADRSAGCAIPRCATASTAGSSPAPSSATSSRASRWRASRARSARCSPTA